MSMILHGNRVFNGTITKDKLAPEVLADIAGGMTSAQVDAKIDAMKMLLFGGDVDAALNSFKELAEAITADRSGLAAMQQVLLGKASPQDITTAVNAMRDLLIGGASDDSNTLKKLETMVKAAQQAAVNALADNVVTNAKLAADVKVGSLNAAANAFPVGVQSGLTSVEKFLVYLSQQLSAVQATAGQQQGTTSGQEARLVAVEQALPNKASQTDFNALGTRVGATEQALAAKATTSDVNLLNSRLGTAESTLGTRAAAADVTTLGNRVTTLENRPTGSSLPAQTGQTGKALLTDGTNAYWGTVATQNTGTGLTDNAIENRHFTADVKVGSLDTANTALGTTSTSVTSLLVAVYNKLLGGASAAYNTLGKLETEVVALKNASGKGFVDVLPYGSLVTQTRSYFRTQTLKKVYKDAGIASASYAKNGGGAVAVPFVGDVATINLSLVAGDRVRWDITYTNGFTEATLEVEGE